MTWRYKCSILGAPFGFLPDYYLIQEHGLLPSGEDPF